MPENPDLFPYKSSSRWAEVSSCQGISSGIYRDLACLLRSVNQGRYLGRCEGSMAPPSRLSDLSGTMRFRSKSMVLPKPWQRGQAPNGLLKLKRIGSGSVNSGPQVLHWNFSLKRI